MNIASACLSLGLSVAIMCCVFGLVAIIGYVTLHANPRDVAIFIVIFSLIVIAVCIAIPIYQWLSEQEKP